MHEPQPVARMSNPSRRSILSHPLIRTGFAVACLAATYSPVAATVHYPVQGTPMAAVHPPGPPRADRQQAPFPITVPRRHRTIRSLPPSITPLLQAPATRRGSRQPQGMAEWQAAPPLAIGFVGITDTGFVPPDPTLAAGPTELVAAVNGGIALFSKTGDLIQQRTLEDFRNGSMTPGGSIFDPRLLYDPHSGRFFTAAIEGSFSPDSWLHIAVSKSSAPNNLLIGDTADEAWWGFVIDADLDGGVQVNNNAADYDAIGIDRDNFYITANMFSNDNQFQYAKVWVLPKAGLLSGVPSAVFEFGAPPDTALGNPVTQLPDYTIMPGLNYDTTAEHLLSANDPATGALTLWTVNTPAETPTLSSRHIMAAPWSDALLPPCPQAGGNDPIDSGDFDLANVIERHGRLWTTHTHPNAQSNPTRTEVRWYEIDPATAAVTQHGDVADPLRCYAFPAIQADAAGNASLVMSGTDATIFPSAFYTTRRAGAAPGTMAPVAPLKIGEAHYVQRDSARVNRWGDFGGIADDPATGEVWMLHEYAAATANQWSTWFGKLPAMAACAGDCNTNGAVTIDEVIAGVRIALGLLPAAACAPVDVNRDQRVTVDELVSVVAQALNHCP